MGDNVYGRMVTKGNAATPGELQLRVLPNLISSNKGVLVASNLLANSQLIAESSNRVKVEITSLVADPQNENIQPLSMSPRCESESQNAVKSLISQKTNVDKCSNLPATYNIFIGGAGDSLFNEEVKKYELAYENKIADKKKYPNSKSKYYTHDAGAEIIADIKEQRKINPAIQINIVGHSWGGDTAIQVAGNENLHQKIDLVITIDPVGGGTKPCGGGRPKHGHGSSLDNLTPEQKHQADAECLKTVLMPRIESARKNITTWIDVDPKPSENNLSDDIANTGGKYDHILDKIANKFILLPGFHHGDFNDMMEKVVGYLDDAQCKN